MSAEREDLATRIVREYHANGIPAKVHHGMVLVHRDGELTGPFRAELLAGEYRAEIERVKGVVRETLRRLGIIDYLMSCGVSPRAAYSRLLMAKELTGESPLFKRERELMAGLEADADFRANVHYRHVVRAIVEELCRSGDGGEHSEE
jgi:hypothetical protein